MRAHKRPARRYEAIARRLQKKILEGNLRPGDRLPAERDLARRLKASRVSVREAYRSLEELGLIFVKRGAEGGAFIAEIDHAPVSRSLALMLQLGKTSHEELTEARLLLEPPIARLAARRAQQADIEWLEGLVRKQEIALEGSGNPRRYDLQFHRLVAQCSRNLPLVLVMNSVADLMVEAISAIQIAREVQHDVAEFHRSIVDAIRRHDEEAAYEIMLRHVVAVQSRLGRSFARQQGPDTGGSWDPEASGQKRVNE